MPNAKDTGNVNVRTDFVWGNMPMIPNDDRGSNTLTVSAYNNHNIVGDAWNAFPSEPAGVNVGDPGTRYVVPTFVVNTTTLANCTAGLVAAGITTITYATTVDGDNVGKFKSISPVAGTKLANLAGAPASVTLTTAVAA